MFGHRSFLVLGSPEGVNLTSLVKGGYELVNFNFSFEQGIDDKGKATTRVYSGAMHVIMSQLPPLAIIEWGMNPRKYQDGVIVILDDENVPQEKIVFQNARCINMEIDYANTGEAYSSTKLVIQAERLDFGDGVDYDNEWTD